MVHLLFNSGSRIRIILFALLGAGLNLFLACNAFAQEHANHNRIYNSTLKTYELIWELAAQTDYRNGGIDQTFGKPVLQGGVGTLLPGGFYIANWNSTVSTGAGYPGAFIETDIFGGWLKQVGDLRMNTGIYSVFYPGSNVANYAKSPLYGRLTSGMVHNGEVFFGLGYKQWYFQQNVNFTNVSNMVGPNGGTTAGSGYSNLMGDFPIAWDFAGGGWTAISHAGYQYMRNYSTSNYVDWKFGLEKKLAGFWHINLLYTQTNAKGNCSIAATTAQPYCFSQSTSASGVNSGPTKNAGGAAIIFNIIAKNY